MNLSAEKVDVRPAYFYRTGLSESGWGRGAMTPQILAEQLFPVSIRGHIIPTSLRHASGFLDIATALFRIQKNINQMGQE